MLTLMKSYSLRAIFQLHSQVCIHNFKFDHASLDHLEVKLLFIEGCEAMKNIQATINLRITFLLLNPAS